MFEFFAFAWGGVLALCVAGVGREGVDVAGSFKYCFRIIQNVRSDCFHYAFLFRATHFQSFSEEQREAKPWPNFPLSLIRALGIQWWYSRCLRKLSLA